MKSKLMLFVSLVAAMNFAKADPDELLSGEILQNNGYRQSQNGQYKLIMQTDGSLVLYRADGTVRYSMAKYGAYATMTPEGNFVEVNRKNEVIWETRTGTTRNNRVIVKSDGNLVVSLPGPSNAIVWAIGTEPGPTDPSDIGHVVGRDLAFTGAGYLGHLGVWDGSQVVQVGPPVSGNNAVHYETLQQFKNTPTGSGQVASYWGTARPPIASGVVRWCFSSSCRTDGLQHETTTARVAIAKGMRAGYLIGADYTATAYWKQAIWGDENHPPQRGTFRCDTWSYAALGNSTLYHTVAGILTPDQRLWVHRHENELTVAGVFPSALFNAIKSYGL